MCKIVNLVETIAASDLTVYKVVRVRKTFTFRRHQNGRLYSYTNREYRSQFSPDARSRAADFGYPGTDVVYRLRKRMIDAPGNNGFYTFADKEAAMSNWGKQIDMAVLECRIPKGTVIRYGEDVALLIDGRSPRVVILTYCLIPLRRIEE